MKKIIILAFAMFAVMSCAEDDAKIFNKTAEERLLENKKEFFNSLVNENWVIDLFPGATEEYGGFAIFADFSENYKVNLVNEIGMQADGTGYDIISREGSLLTFNEYNKAIHVFSQPSSKESEGPFKTVDYEFIYVKSEGDILYTKGVKTSNSIRFVKTDLAPEVYFNKQKEVQKFIQERVAFQFLVGEKQLDFNFGIGDFGRILAYNVVSTVKKEGKDVEEKELFKNAFVYTDKGIRFYENIKGTEVFELILDVENNVLKSEDGKVQIKLFKAPVDLNKEDWRMFVDNTNVSVKVAEMFKSVANADLNSAYPGKLIPEMVIGTLTLKTGLDKPGVSFFSTEIKSTKTYRTEHLASFPIDVDKDGNFYIGIVPSTDKLGMNWKWYKHLQPMVDFLATNSFYKVEILEEGKIKLVSQKDPDVWFILAKNTK